MLVTQVFQTRFARASPIDQMLDDKVSGALDSQLGNLAYFLANLRQYICRIPGRIGRKVLHILRGVSRRMRDIGEVSLFRHAQQSAQVIPGIWRNVIITNRGARAPIRHLPPTLFFVFYRSRACVNIISYLIGGFRDASDHYSQ